MRHQVTSCEFAHLASADDKYVLAVQVAEDLLGKLYRNRSNRHGRRSDRGFRTDALGYREGTAEELIELSANGTDGSCSRISFLHLTQDLRFAHHHRVQARGDAEDVPYRVLLAELIQMSIECARIEMKMIVQESAQIGMAVRGMGDDLDAVAG